MNIHTESLKTNSHHFALAACSQMNEIILPKLKRHGITRFAYAKVDADGSIIYLDSHKEWTEYFFKKGYYNSLTVPKSFDLTPHSVYRTLSSPCLSKKMNYFLLSIKECPSMLIDAHMNFDIANGINIAERNDDSIEYYSFSTHRNNTSIINNFYLNNLELLQNYCYSFKEQAKALLNLANKEKIILSKSKDIEVYSKLPSSHLLLEYPKLYKRQFDCANLLLKGMTNKEIGKIIGISHRTVESHIDFLKSKFRCRNKVELIVTLIYILNHN